MARKPRTAEHNKKISFGMIKYHRQITGVKVGQSAQYKRWAKMGSLTRFQILKKLRDAENQDKKDATARSGARAGNVKRRVKQLKPKLKIKPPKAKAKQVKFIKKPKAVKKKIIIKKSK